MNRHCFRDRCLRLFFGRCLPFAGVWGGGNGGGRKAVDHNIQERRLTQTLELPGVYRGVAELTGFRCLDLTSLWDGCGNNSHIMVGSDRARQRMAGLDPPIGGKNPATLTQFPQRAIDGAAAASAKRDDRDRGLLPGPRCLRRGRIFLHRA